MKNYNLMRYKYILLFIFFVCGYNVSSQSKSSYSDYRFLEFRGHSGAHLYTGEELKDALESGYGAVEVKYGWQSSNPGGWQSMYLYPSYGIGWYSGFIGNPELLGKPGAFFGFIAFPLFYHHRHQIILEPALGLSYDLKPYNEESNAQNDAIGSRFNAYFNINIGAQYSLNREIDLLYGIDLTHFSNGRTYRPNSGLNMFGLNIGFRYHFNTRQRKADNSIFPETILDVRPVHKHFSPVEQVEEGRVLFYTAGGLVQNIEDKGTNKQYFAHTSMLEYQYQLNSKSAFTLGVDFFYDNSLVSNYTDKKHHFSGAHIGYDYIFWKLSIRMQAGTYLSEKGHDIKGSYFFRPALKFDINRRFFVQLGLKSQAGLKADWVEMGAGMRLW
jgi:hypothetical protein